MTNSADPDQLASSSEANWSGSTLFAKTGHDVLSKRRVNNDNNSLERDGVDSNRNTTDLFWGDYNNMHICNHAISKRHSFR